jgi:hypothetical protein
MVSKRQESADRRAAASPREGGKGAPTAAPDLEALLGRPRQELLELAADLGLKAVSKLAKPELARRVHEAQAAVVPARAAAAGKAAPAGPARALAEKAPAEKVPAAKGAALKPAPGGKAAGAKPAARTSAAKAEKPPPGAAAEKTAPPERAAGKAAAREPAERPSTPVARAPEPPTEPPARTVHAAAPEPPAPPEHTAVAEPPAAGEIPKEPPNPAAAARLDLGHASPARPREEHIPWSYGQDRVTAMAVDPETLYVYWEVTDPAIERARAALGAAGEAAWLNLRVHDTTGIIFDGGNAHSWFDHGLGRSDRQWFFRIGKPSSSATVEIGLRAPDGGFVRIARSSRVDFAPVAPGAWSEPEWMTVLASGEPVHAGRGAPVRPGEGGGAGQVGRGFGGVGRHEHVPVWILLEPGEGERRFRELFGEHWERIEWQEGGAEGWYELQGRLEWQVGPILSSWEEGPFSYPVAVEPPTRSSWEGGAIAYTQGGITRVVYGPWQVVIRNLGGRAAHAVVGRWQIFRSWATSGGLEEIQRMATRLDTPGGASERTAASAWLWRAGSEERLGGASELWRIGASEVRLRGASELLYAGASERRAMGASERHWAGASEWRLGGASERQLQGASEWRLGGASEWQLQGASERRLGGASERVLGGASEARLGGSEGRLGGPQGQAEDDWDWPPAGPSAPGRE